jgi:methylenetetrahydrofolate dehydrogenase (NADP+)/methenyltetrahydrofolate cyclohydrolase
MEMIDGKAIADNILKKLKVRLVPKKFFGAVLVGDDKSSVSFLKQKEKTAKELGIDFRLYRFSETIQNDELRQEVGKIAAHKTCGGALIQLPLPAHLNQQYILNAIPKEKDVDVLSERAIGAFYADRSILLPPAVGVVEELIANRKLQIAHCSVAVVGLGFLVGRPVANWIMRRAKETLLLRSVSDLGFLKYADIVVTSVGKAGLIVPDMLKDGAGVIDFGYGILDGKYSGDLDTRELAMSDSRLAFYTPTPGGTGPIDVAKLFENFYELNRE